MGTKSNGQKEIERGREWEGSVCKEEKAQQSVRVRERVCERS